MNADEIVRALRALQEKHKDDFRFTGELCISDMVRDCADMIESQAANIAMQESQINIVDNANAACLIRIAELEAKISESQRRERAAVADLEIMARNSGTCFACLFLGPKFTCKRLKARPCWQWRGPQEAGE